jgi:hypothetical protein
MSDQILIKSKAIPSNPRSKNYPAGATVVRSGSGGGSTVVSGGSGGNNIDVLKVDDMRSLTDKNVFSSLRALFEIRSRIIKKEDLAEYTDDNIFSSLRTIEEVDARIQNVLNVLEKGLGEKLSKVDNDTAAGLITFLKGLISEGLIKAQEGIELGDFLSGILGIGGCFKVDPKTGKSYIEADEMYIRLKAVFDSLEIRHTTHVGGQQILSPAGMTCIRVEEYPTFYRCFMKADDGSKAVLNLFAEGDQAQCRDMNVLEGVYENISNQYY